jgi:LuxR family maltose regulon positive regulatory protein
MALVRAARGDLASANDLLDQAEALYRHGFYPDLRPIAALRARLQIAAGDLTSATRWADDRGISVEDDPDYLREYDHLTLARLLLARYRDEVHGTTARGTSLAALLGLLRRLHLAATTAGRDGSVLEIAVMQALTHHAHGDLPAALAALTRALVEAPEPDAHVCLYLDEGAQMTALLTDWLGQPGEGDGTADAGRDPEVRARVRRLLGRAATVEGAALPRTTNDSLSPRELDVTRLLATDLSGPEIARELFITVNTLRTHTKRIFTKLDATTRAVAVQRARERGLL